MPVRTSCKPVSLYRLDGSVPLEDCLGSLSSVGVDTDTRVELDGIGCRAVIGSFASDNPWWSQHVAALTDQSVDVGGVQPFAVLLIPMTPWTYTLTWGAGHLLLDDELVEQGFGVLFGIRRLDPVGLAMIATSTLDASGRSTQTSVPGGTDVAGFNLDPYGDIVNRFAGSADLSGLTYGAETNRRHRIQVGNGLRVPLPQQPGALLRDLRAIGATVDQSDEHSALRVLAQVRPVARHAAVRVELDARLAMAIGGDPDVGPLAVAWPAAALDDGQMVGSFRVLARRPVGWYPVGPELELADLIGPLADLPLAARVAALWETKVVACLDEDGREQAGSLISLRKWLVFETVINTARYCYCQGDWYQVGENFVGRIREQVAELLTHRSTLCFPTWRRTGRQDDEHLFCELAARQPGFLCLDRNFARTPFHPRFELCDVVGPDDELVHVKWLSRATAASHLYVQADVSAQALRDEPEALEQLRAKVQALDPERRITDPSTVVLAIGGRQWDVDKLFTLSQVGLLRLHRTLRYLQMGLRFADIPFVPLSGDVDAPLAA